MATEYFQANISAIVGGQRAEIVTHWRTIDPTETDDYELAVQLITAIATDGAPNSLCGRISFAMSTGAYLSAIRCKRVAPTGGNTAINVFTTTAFDGTIASEIAPQQNAGVIIWSSLDNPQVTGRNFIYGVPENAVQGGNWTDTYRDFIEDIVTKWLPGFTTAGGTWEPVIYDRVAKTGRVMDNGYLSPVVGVQRRREVPV